MITIKHETARYTVTEANAAKYRAMLDSGKPRKFSQRGDPKHDSMRRDYPAFYPGMDTAEYISKYQSLNNRLYASVWQFDHADRPAPMLDPTQPEVLEELDADYIEQAPAPKRKATTAAQYRKACQDALDYLAKGDTDTAACVLSEVLG